MVELHEHFWEGLKSIFDEARTGVLYIHVTGENI
jgi:hypothetical protein